MELLDWLKHEGKSSKAIWHPLFYRYPWSLRFELGDPALDDDEAYFCSAEERAQRIWDTAFAAEDEVLLIFDGTPDRELKDALRSCRMQRVRAPRVTPFPGEDEEEDEGFFYRYYYLARAGEFPFQAVLERGFSWKYGIYLYNRTRKLLFHPYDDRGAELTFSDLGPYWKAEGWGEFSVTITTAQPLASIQNRLARKWDSDTASAETTLPDVGFLWVHE